MPDSNPLLTARSLILLQLLSRILTFSLNQTLLRLASPAVFGTAAIQFDLVCSSILFLSREGIRNALLRRNNEEGNKTQGKNDEQTHALSIMPLRLGALLATAISGIYLWSSSSITTSQQGFHLSLGLYVLSALLELSIEPYYIRVHTSTPPRLNVRVQAEGGMAIVKAVITVASLLGLGERHALLSFALGQVAGALWLAVRYIQEYNWNVQSLLVAKRRTDQPRSDPGLYSLAMANTGQSFIKHVLTEADRFAVARLSPLDDQGGYAVAMNYGSLVARIVFQPLEESLLLHYSSSLKSPATLPLFTETIRLSLYLGTLVRTFVPPLFPALSPFLLPRQYLDTSAPSILRLYLTTYIPLLSLNGVAESFHTASADPSEVRLQARWMVASSGVFAGTLALLASVGDIYTTSHGAPSSIITLNQEQRLVLASSAAMLVRIVYALRHARRSFSLHKPSLRLLNLLPSLKVLSWAVVARSLLGFWSATDRWQSGWKGWVELVGAGGVLGVVSLVFIYLAERDRLQELRMRMKVGKQA
ncbi:hypothetical protein B9479_002660 [Cryptococcus floricola]|uniref:Man(5)GlcNAc(2)-PP-dolichol translocation protein RFT1 n=1 Tax=Cryptococcus floricola TaxID=2591691 RepID=A0A5D3B0F8_9TREE|nr:hypothetical protein B9479_002660 [Cryptococcus floricola]